MKLTDAVELILKKKGSRVHAIAPDATVYEALEQLAAKDIGALVVMEGPALAGVFSERDYVRKVVIKGHTSRDLRVRDIMSAPAVTVERTATVDECMHLMTSHRFRHLPVVDSRAAGGRAGVVGVVSIGDLVNWIITAQDVALQELEGYITGKYPG